MFQSRDAVRQIYINVWRKMQARQPLEPMEAIIADVIQIHPEYHALLSKGDDARDRDFLPEAGETNPFLHMGMHIALREQNGTDRPTGFRDIYQKLVNRMGAHDAEHAMIECLAEALWRSQKDNRPFDEKSYMQQLKML